MALIVKSMKAVESETFPVMFSNFLTAARVGASSGNGSSGARTLVGSGTIEALLSIFLLVK